MKTVLLNVGNQRVTAELETIEDRIYFKYGWCPPLNDELKITMGGRWNPDRKQWHVEDSHHNHFRIAVLRGQNPYGPYDTPIDLAGISSERSLFQHQLYLKAFGLQRHQCIWAAEPGTGKSLALIEVAESVAKQPPLLDPHGHPIEREFWWVAPKAALFSVQLECLKWNSKVLFRFMTYEKMKSTVATWTKGKPAPQLVGFDEASRVKNKDADRSKSAKYLADKMRDEYGRDAYVILMSGTPAPQSPLDWYWLMQIAVPGFLKEGNYWKFRDGICLVKEEEGRAGGTFPKLVTWYDSDAKCKKCGKQEVDILHTNQRHPDFHAYEQCTNEVARLYNRMQGAVHVLRKKDCLDLPEKIFKRIECPIPPAMMRAAKMIPKTVGTGTAALCILRELSDGFQYEATEVGQKECDLCNGTKTVEDVVYTGPEATDEFMTSLGLISGIDCLDPVRFPDYYKLDMVECPKCKGTGSVAKVAGVAKYIGSPKDEAMNELFDEYDDHGRLVVYGAFQATVDNLVKLAIGKGWDWIKADGRSWASSMGGSPLTWLADFENRKSETKKLVFIGQPEAAGMGLTLTAACACVFYSNSFNAESRLQAIERIHRTGASKELGVTIIDLIGLPTDSYILAKLDAKETLQAITMGSLEKCLDTPSLIREAA